MTPHNMAKIGEHPRQKFCLKTLPYSRVQMVRDTPFHCWPLTASDRRPVLTVWILPNALY